MNCSRSSSCNTEAFGRALPVKETNLPQWVGDATIQALGGAIFIVREVGGRAVNKALDHVLESFIVSPALTGLPFGKSGLGRGNWGPSFKFFPW